MFLLGFVKEDLNVCKIVREFRIVFNVYCIMFDYVYYKILIK